MWVVAKLWPPFGVPEIIGAVLKIGTQKGTIILTTTHIVESRVSIRNYHYDSGKYPS